MRHAKTHGLNIAALGVMGALAMFALVFGAWMLARWFWEAVLVGAFVAALRIWWPR